MSEWPLRRVGDIVERRRERITLEPNVEYRTMGVRWYGKGSYFRGIETTETIKAKSLFVARRGDFTFNRIDTQKGAFDVIPESLDGALVTNEFPLYAGGEEIDTNYLLLHFQQQSVLDEIGRSRAGSEGRARWKEADFESATLRLPSLSEQRRIVDLVGSLDAQIEMLGQEIAAANAMLVAGCRTLASPSTCESIVTLAEECDILDTLRMPVNERERAHRMGTVPYYGANGQVGLIDQAVFDEPLTLVPEDQHAGFFSMFLRKRMAYSIEGPAWVNNHAHVLRARTTSRDWVYYSLRHRDLLEFVTDATRSKLTRKNLERISLGIPDDWQQRAERLRGIEDTCSALTAESESLQAVRQRLLERLLERVIVIPESYDVAVAEAV